MLLGISYHYIGPEGEYAQGIYPVSVERFERQLKALQDIFTFVGQKEILDALHGRQQLPKHAAVVTFDDGLRGQYDLALPILKKYGIPGIFFVCGLPYEEQHALLVHKIHWCRAKLAPKEFLDFIGKEYQRLTGDVFSLDSLGVSDERIRAQYLYDDIDEARLKFLLNKSALTITVRNAIIDQMFTMLVPDEIAFCKQAYIPKNGLKELLRMKSLGVHGYSHVPLASLNSKALDNEITKTRDVVAIITGSDVHEIQGISYPFGALDLVSEACVIAAEKNGFKFGFTMERAFNTSLREPLLFGRLDANDIPEGKAPLFEIRSGDVRILDSRVAVERRGLTQKNVRTIYE